MDHPPDSRSHCDITSCTTLIHSRPVTEDTSSDDRQEVRVQARFCRNPKVIGATCCEWSGCSQSWSSSYSAAAKDWRSQVDVMSPASLLSCPLPLHNWRRGNVSWSSKWKGKEESQGKRLWRKEPLNLTQSWALKRKPSRRTLLLCSVCTELRQHEEGNQWHDMRLHDVLM